MGPIFEKLILGLAKGRIAKLERQDRAELRTALERLIQIETLETEAEALISESKALMEESARLAAEAARLASNLEPQNQILAEWRLRLRNRVRQSKGKLTVAPVVKKRNYTWTSASAEIETPERISSGRLK